MGPSASMRSLNTRFVHPQNRRLASLVAFDLQIIREFGPVLGCFLRSVLVLAGHSSQWLRINRDVAERLPESRSGRPVVEPVSTASSTQNNRDNDKHGQNRNRKG